MSQQNEALIIVRHCLVRLRIDRLEQELVGRGIVIAGAVRASTMPPCISVAP
jgi:hypothetical protein